MSGLLFEDRNGETYVDMDSLEGLEYTMDECLIDARRASFNSAVEEVRNLRGDESKQDFIPYLHPATIAEVAGEYGTETAIGFMRELTDEIQEEDELDQYRDEVETYLAFREIMEEKNIEPDLNEPQTDGGSSQQKTWDPLF